MKFDNQNISPYKVVENETAWLNTSNLRQTAKGNKHTGKLVHYNWTYYYPML